jgi:hypothetical protein
MLPIYLRNPDSEAAKLVGNIELGLSEIHSGLRTERSFKIFISKQLSKPVFYSVDFPTSYTDDLATSSTFSVTGVTHLDFSDQQSPSWSSEPQVVNV